MKIKRHVRYAWGIEYIEASCDPLLIDPEWCGYYETVTFRGISSQYLLFETRAEARAWCSDKNKDSKRIGGKRSWYFRPVKVRETIEIIGR